MKRELSFLLNLTLVGAIAACGDSDSAASTGSDASTTGTTAAPEDDHVHSEVSLGTVTIGDLEVELAQNVAEDHGAVAAGQEGHLVVKLPYSDSGSTIVRAWIGTDDRTLSLVGKGEYAPSHDDYDITTTAPDPLPADTKWWIEIEKPDGTKLVGSVQPIME